MGTCCFTPKKTEFLWWYWLLLFSVVGIPMFIAALYMANRSKGEQAKKHAVIAFVIFLGASIISITFVFIFLSILAEHPTFINFLLGFSFCMLVTIGACKEIEKHSRKLKRIGILLCYVLLWYAIYVVSFFFLSYGWYGIYGSQGSVGAIVMQFAVCMLPVHYWHQFSTAPHKKNACKFLVAFFIGALLFWAAVRYGNLVNIYFYKLIRGQIPTRWEIYHKYVVF